MLQSLVSWKHTPSLMPTSQAVLLWLKEQLPQHFEPVLARARELENAPAPRRAS